MTGEYVYRTAHSPAVHVSLILFMRSFFFASQIVVVIRLFRFARHFSRAFNTHFIQFLHGA